MDYVPDSLGFFIGFLIVACMRVHGQGFAKTYIHKRNHL